MKVFKFCKPYLKQHILKIMLFALYGIAIQFLSLVTPYITGHFIDGLLTKNSMDFVFRFCGLLIIVVLIRLTLQYLQSMSYVKLQSRMGYELNRDIIFYVQDLPLSFLNNQDIARLNSQINGDANDLIIFCLGILNAFILHLFSLPTLLVLCFFINWEITICFMIYCCLYILIFHTVKKYRYRIAHKLYESQNTFFSFLHEQLSYINYIKINGVSSFFRKRLDKPYEDLFTSSCNNQRFEAFLATIDDILGLVADITLYLIGAYQIFSGNFTIGNFIIFSAYFAMAKQSIQYFYNFGSTYQQALVRHDRTKKLLDENPEAAGEVKISSIEQIEFCNLKFGYVNNRLIINGLNLQLKKGNMYGIIGQNGIGKTTLAKILLGLFNSNIEKGMVNINGNQDLTVIQKQLLRHEKIAYVEQFPILINDEILSNIVLDREITEDLLLKIQKLAEVLNMETLIFCKNNYKQDINNLSGGERQKIAIIRALIKDADIYILDEPTASLDSKSSTALLNILRELKKDKIVIIITHEENVIKECDSLITCDKWSIASNYDV